MFRDVHMGDKVFPVRAISFRIIAEAGDFSHEQGDISFHIPKAGNGIIPEGEGVIFDNDFSLVTGKINNPAVGIQIFSEPGIHTQLHGGILHQENRVMGKAFFFYEFQGVGHVITAVGGGCFQIVRGDAVFLG